MSITVAILYISLGPRKGECTPAAGEFLQESSQLILLQGGE